LVAPPQFAPVCVEQTIFETYLQCRSVGGLFPIGSRSAAVRLLKKRWISSRLRAGLMRRFGQGPAPLPFG
jgi:hypothetical protein